MSQLKRISDDDSLGFSQSLLRSAASDGPSEGARERAAAAIGVSLVGSASVVAVSHASAQAAGLVGKAKALILLQWTLALGVPVATLGAGATLYLASQHAAPASTPTTATATATRRATGTLESVSTMNGDPTLEPMIATNGEPTPISPGAPNVASEPAAPSLSDVRPESRLLPRHRGPSQGSSPLAGLERLDAARHQLRAGDGAASLRELEAFDRERHEASLQDIAQVLRIESLFVVGDARGAQTLGKAFLRDRPSSALAERVRSLLLRK